MVVTESWSKECSKCTLWAPPRHLFKIPFISNSLPWWLVESGLLKSCFRQWSDNRTSWVNICPAQSISPPPCLPLSECLQITGTLPFRVTIVPYRQRVILVMVIKQSFGGGAFRFRSARYSPDNAHVTTRPLPDDIVKGKNNDGK